MSFVLGVVFGIAFGLAIIVAFVKSGNARSKQRTDLASETAAFARMTVEDARKIFTPEQYPTWVVFSNQQKLAWFNSNLEKIWPYVDKAASELVKSSVEPILEQYRPVILTSLKFSEFTLGTVAPQFTGISIIEDGSEGITMELEMQWDGNTSIILDIITCVGVALPVQVKNIAFAGTFRLIFRRLVDEFPCFGAVCYSLRQKKKLDFTLKVFGGDMTAIPGVSDAIEGTIRMLLKTQPSGQFEKLFAFYQGIIGALGVLPEWHEQWAKLPFFSERFYDFIRELPEWHEQWAKLPFFSERFYDFIRQLPEWHEQWAKLPFFSERFYDFIRESS